MDDLTESWSHTAGPPLGLQDTLAWKGAFGLPPIHRTEIRGVPTFWADVPGPARAGLVFRVGRGYEQLAQAGVSHLVEHLTLASLDAKAYAINGQVEIARTTFFAGGTADQIRSFLEGVAAALQAVPCLRLPVERRVLQTEAAARNAGAFGNVLVCRYGATGPGLVGYEEFGLRSLEQNAVRSWAEQWFCAENAALWLTFEPRADFDLRLPAGGSRAGYPPFTQYEFDTPSILYQDAPGGVAFSGITARSAAATSFGRILAARMQAKLRDELGISYQTNVDYFRLDKDRAHFFCAADALPDRSGELLNAMVDVLDGVRNDGTTIEEIQADADRFEAALADPNRILSVLAGSATGALEGSASTLPDVLLEQLRAVEPSAHARVADEVFKTALWVAPRNAGAPSRRHAFNSYPAWSVGRVSGRSFKPLKKGRKSAHPVGLTIGSDGVTYFHDDDKWVTVVAESCAALLQWTDGQRQLIGRDGFRLPLVPAIWRKGEDITQLVDRMITRDKWVPMGAPAVPQPARRRAGWNTTSLAISAVLLVLGTLSLLSALTAPPTTYDPTTGFVTTVPLTSRSGFATAMIFYAGAGFRLFLYAARRLHLPRR